MSHSGLQNYRTMGAYGDLADATPYQVVQVMLDAVLARVAEATGHVERGEVSAKGEKIGKALGIIEALTLGLDKAGGGEIAANLERLRLRVADVASGTARKSRRPVERGRL